MPNYQAIAPASHAALRWKRFDSYAFAAHEAVAPLVAQELPRACLHLPLAFIAQGEAFAPVAVLGLQPGQNLFVTPDGRWAGGYIPAAYRGHPFALAQTPDNQLVLCVDADSGLVSASEGELFFDKQGQPAQAVKDVLDFLQQVHANRPATQRLCAALQAEEGLIVPWPLTLKSDKGEQTVQGLCRIDEAKLNALDSDALTRLHRAGALPIAYCQLLSMQHIQTLGRLAEAHTRATAAQLPTTDSGDLDLEFLNKNGTISFGELR